jgi:hypothetical protein
MLIEEAQEISDKACHYFCLEKVRIQKCRSNTAYFMNTESLNIIRINTDIPSASGDYALAHELSHHVAFEIHRNRSHDFVFYSCLVEVVQWYYDGNTSLYRWDQEYERIKKWHSMYGAHVKNFKLSKRLPEIRQYRSGTYVSEMPHNKTKRGISS